MERIETRYIGSGVVYYGNYWTFDLVGHNCSACIWLIPGADA